MSYRVSIKATNGLVYNMICCFLFLIAILYYVAWTKIVNDDVRKSGELETKQDDTQYSKPTPPPPLLPILGRAGTSSWAEAILARESAGLLGSKFALETI